MSEIDLRSYFPELKRRVTLPDGNEYSIREMADLPIGTFNRIIVDEKSFAEIKFLERHVIEREHVQILVVSPVTIRGNAPKGEKILRLSGDGELELESGDLLHVSGGLYYERNVVESVAEDKRSAVMQSAWRFDASDGARVYRAVRSSVIDMLSFIQMAELIVKIKTPAAYDQGEEGPTDPPTAASEPSSSTISSLP